MTTLEINTVLRPLLDTAAEYRREWNSMESSIEGLLEDLDLMQLQLEEKNLALAAAEQQLAEERDDNRKLLQRLEQQDARLTETLNQLKQLTSEQQQLQQALLMAAESSLAISDDVRESAILSSSASNAIPAEVAAELKQLRTLLEAQAAMRTELPASSPSRPEASSASAPPTNAPAAEGDAPASGNSVVSSVMAQFAKLQQDVAQRKKRR